MRLAEVKSSTGSLAALNLTGSCRAVLCLDLAADAFDIPITKVKINYNINPFLNVCSTH